MGENSEKKPEIKILDAKFHGILLQYSLSPLFVIHAFNKQLLCAQNYILGNSKQEYKYHSGSKADIHEINNSIGLEENLQ